MLSIRHPNKPWLIGIFLLLLLDALYFTATLLLPITLAFMFSLLLSPPVRWLNKLAIPTPVGAAVILLALLMVVFQAGWLLSGPAADWLGKAPQSFREVAWKLRELRESFDEVQEATKQVEEMTVIQSDNGTTAMKVEVTQPSLTESVLSATPRVIGNIGVGVILLYFLLASGDTFLRKVVRIAPTMEDKRRAVEIARRIQHDVSGYLFTIALINAGLGAVVALCMWYLGMPNPVLWGVMVGALNFAPYVGAVVSLVVLSVVAILSFDTLSQAILPPLVFLGLTTLEGQLLNPTIVGRRLSLNPVVVFLNITFWGWLWGIPGVLLAVPLLAIAKIICEQVESLHTISEFLGSNQEPKV